MTKTVPDRLRDAAKLFEERNAAYGSNYLTFGRVLLAMLPEGITLRTEEEFQRFALFVVAMMKQTRYAKNLLRGGHADSLEDEAVYAMMLRETDDIARTIRETNEISNAMLTQFEAHVKMEQEHYDLPEFLTTDEWTANERRVPRP